MILIKVHRAVLEFDLLCNEWFEIAMLSALSFLLIMCTQMYRMFKYKANSYVLKKVQ